MELPLLVCRVAWLPVMTALEEAAEQVLHLAGCEPDWTFLHCHDAKAVLQATLVNLQPQAKQADCQLRSRCIVTNSYVSQLILIHIAYGCKQYV